MPRSPPPCLSAFLEPKASTLMDLHPQVLSLWGVSFCVPAPPLPPSASVSLSPEAGVHCQIPAAGCTSGSLSGVPAPEAAHAPGAEGLSQPMPPCPALRAREWKRSQTCATGRGPAWAPALWHRAAASHGPVPSEVHVPACRATPDRTNRARQEL